MENQPEVFCGRNEKHIAHGPTCPGTGACGSRDTHEPHLVLEGSLAPYHCFGDRVRLYREKHVTVDGRKLLDTVWPEDPVPLLAVDDIDDRIGHHGASLIGKVEGVRREPDTGWVTGLVITRMHVSGLAAEADFVLDTFTPDPKIPDVMVATGARLAAVTIGDRPTWDEMRIP
jgi:hypothetical protein